MNDRISITVLVLAVAGLALGWNSGELPARELTDIDTQVAGGLAPDLALYCEIIADVRGGRDYYDSARERIPQYGFPITSPLNWRLPTYAWLLACLPCNGLIQAALILLSMAALGLAFLAQSKTHGLGFAAITAFLLFGVVRWSIDGHAYLAQEPWAATLILISLCSFSLSSANTNWRYLAIAAGIAALFFRELALPYCLVALLHAAWHKRWAESIGWGAGIASFLAFFVWHASQVKAQLAGIDVASSAGIAQWLRFSGLDFVLLTTRMNSLFFSAPGWLLWSYLLLALFGLARSQHESSRLACLASLLYIAAFAVLGRPENFYWGLIPAPLLAWGASDALQLARVFLHDSSQQKQLSTCNRLG